MLVCVESRSTNKGSETVFFGFVDLEQLDKSEQATRNSRKVPLHLELKDETGDLCISNRFIQIFKIQFN